MAEKATQGLPVRRRRRLRGNYWSWGCAGWDKREKGYRLFVAAGGRASNDDHNNCGTDQPERNENRVGETRSGGWHERREDDECDAENGDGLTCSRHLSSPAILPRSNIKAGRPQPLTTIIFSFAFFDTSDGVPGVASHRSTC